MWETASAGHLSSLFYVKQFVLLLILLRPIEEEDKGLLTLFCLHTYGV
jgi:hypothetical protein